MKKEASRQTFSAVFEGMTSIDAVIKASYAGSDRKILRVLYDRDRADSKKRELSYIKHVGERLGFTVEGVSRDTIDRMTIGTSHGGIIAECSDRTIPELSGNELADQGFYLMLDGIEDPYNFGYALRTAYAAGVDGIILPNRSWMSAAGVVCRSSAGASELLPSFMASADDACRIFRERGYKIACAGIRNSVSAFDSDLSLPLLLIVGGERRGISAVVLSMADITVRLDYGRQFRGSLSAASAESILTYEVLRQNRDIKAQPSHQD